MFHANYDKKKIVLSVEEEKAKLSYPNIITPPPPPRLFIADYFLGLLLCYPARSNSKTNQTAFVVKLIKSEQQEDGDIFSLCFFS